MKVSNSTITFRIDVDFEGSDVDMVLNEMRARGVQSPMGWIAEATAKSGKDLWHDVDTSKLDVTPTEASVNFALNWLAGYVDRNEMCIVNSKWDKDYSAEMITAKTESGTEYSTYPEFKTELEELGIKVESWYGLLQGTCHLNCEVPAEDFSPELVEKATEIVHDVFAKLVIYHNAKNFANC